MLFKILKYTTLYTLLDSIKFFGEKKKIRFNKVKIEPWNESIDKDCIPCSIKLISHIPCWSKDTRKKKKIIILTEFVYPLYYI